MSIVIGVFAFVCVDLGFPLEAVGHGGWGMGRERIFCPVVVPGGNTESVFVCVFEGRKSRLACSRRSLEMWMWMWYQKLRCLGGDVLVLASC